ncbi:thioredoxin family protein [Neptunicella sp. SCSIO 80796]|uniref:thioredoxin family protein n=1 Tax=Neptunicella plasticusilytica TaxID=3117012 RepID=UPI003A4D46E6
MVNISGPISAQQLLGEYQQFATEYRSFQPTIREITMMSKLDGKSILVLFGLWCHDSQREIPRLLKLIDQSGVTLSSLRLVAVDGNKQDPSGISEQYHLRFTPTIILLQDGRELGRVVEKPVHSLSEDLTSI